MNFDDILTGVFKDKRTRFSPNYLDLKNRFEKVKDFVISNSLHEGYTNLEWGFPKGKRHINETNLECSIREFREESSYDLKQINLLHSVLPMKEIILGTDNIIYRYIYNLSILKDMEYTPIIDEKNYEVRNIQWISINDINTYFRDYHTEKKKIVTEIFKFIINIIEN